MSCVSQFQIHHGSEYKTDGYEFHHIFWCMDPNIVFYVQSGENRILLIEFTEPPLRRVKYDDGLDAVEKFIDDHVLCGAVFNPLPAYIVRDLSRKIMADAVKSKTYSYGKNGRQGLHTRKNKQDSEDFKDLRK